MIISDEAALVILAMFAVVGLVLLAVFVLGVRSFLRGRRVLGVLLMLVPLGLVFGPAAVDGVRNARLRPVIDAANHYPEALDLRGQRVLFVADSSTICDGLCGEMVSYGVPAEVYWVGLRSSYDGIPRSGGHCGDDLTPRRGSARHLGSCNSRSGQSAFSRRPPRG